MIMNSVTQSRFCNYRDYFRPGTDDASHRLAHCHLAHMLRGKLVRGEKRRVVNLSVKLPTRCLQAPRVRMEGEIISSRL